MQPVRRARLEAVIQEELSVMISREIKDPRVPTLTITSVQVTPDAEQATVFVSILGSDESAESKRKMKECLEGLTSAAGFMRRHLARILSIRHIPALVFKEDRGYANVSRVHELLKQINTESGETKSDPGDGSGKTGTSE